MTRAHHCRACFSTIHSKASLCPHCGTRQQASPWLSLANVLKWVGAATAVISLVLTLHKVDGLLKESQLRQQAVSSYIQAGELQQQYGDYRGAWQHFSQALQLSPGHPAANEARLKLARVWLRHAVIHEGETFEAFVAPLIPVLYEGAAQGRKRDYADTMALFLDTLDTAPIQRNHFAHENIRPRVHGRSHF